MIGLGGYSSADFTTEFFYRRHKLAIVSCRSNLFAALPRRTDLPPAFPATQGTRFLIGRAVWILFGVLARVPCYMWLVDAGLAELENQLRCGERGAGKK